MADDENTSLNPLATLAKQSQETAKGYQDTADKLRAKPESTDESLKVDPDLDSRRVRAQGVK
jgi:hypothetical protein